MDAKSLQELKRIRDYCLDGSTRIDLTFFILNLENSARCNLCSGLNETKEALDKGRV